MKKLPNTNKILKEIVNNFNITKGAWTLLADACERSAGMITLPDGRQAQVQIKVTVDNDDFILD